jgi:hypothetical protein
MDMFDVANMLVEVKAIPHGIERARLDIKLCCYVNFDSEMGMRLADYNVGQNLGPVRPEQATKGLRGVKFPGKDESACSFVLMVELVVSCNKKGAAA